MYHLKRKKTLPVTVTRQFNAVDAMSMSKYVFRGATTYTFCYLKNFLNNSLLSNKCNRCRSLRVGLPCLLQITSTGSDYLHLLHFAFSVQKYSWNSLKTVIFHVKEFWRLKRHFDIWNLAKFERKKITKKITKRNESATNFNKIHEKECF